MEDSKRQDEVTIIDKDESSEKVLSVVGGFLIEESINPFPNSKLSFIPEDYGKKDTGPTPPTRLRSKPPAKMKIDDPTLPPGHARCEYCSEVGEAEKFLAPSRRFCNVTCCKRYSAEKRYYPYGKDEEGVAMSIEQGLVNRHRALRPNSAKNKKTPNSQLSSREERKRRLAAYYAGGSSNTTPTDGPPSSKKAKGGRKSGTATPSQDYATPSRDYATSSGVTASDKNNPFFVPYAHPLGTPLHQWSIDDVGEFLTYLGYEAYIDKFQEHEIDGHALSLVKDHHLLMTLKLRLGPSLKIVQQVNALKMSEEIEE